MTHVGVFHYTRMPFGLSSALLPENNGYHLRWHSWGGRVHGRHRGARGNIPSARRPPFQGSEHNLTLNKEKCIFAAPAIEFVGFRLIAEGLSPLHSNVDAVLQLPEPSCPAQLSAFMGMTAYYLRFLPEY